MDYARGMVWSSSGLDAMEGDGLMWAVLGDIDRETRTVATAGAPGVVLEASR